MPEVSRVGEHCARLRTGLIPVALVYVMKKNASGAMWPLILAAAASFLHSSRADSQKLSIPPRLQWNANAGYCGEVSLISAGLYYGQYVSQYDARIAAIGSVPQSKGELLLGVNDRRAASNLHLNSIEWKTSKETSTEQFLTWVKRNIIRGYPVAIGVFTNEYLFYGNTDPDAGDPQYDHIVPVFRIRSHHPVSSRRYFSDDRVSFSDNGLWGNSHTRKYHFTYPFGAFQSDRTQANAPNGPVYALPNGARNYGIAITGVMDTDGDTLPVRVATDKNYEAPAMKDGSNARPTPMPLTLKITVSKLIPDTLYRLYRYSDLASVPDSHFNAHASAASSAWSIQIPSGSTYIFTQQIRSDDIAIYRAVKAAAP